MITCKLVYVTGSNFFVPYLLMREIHLFKLFINALTFGACSTIWYIEDNI